VTFICGKFKEKMYKTNLHTLAEQRNNICPEISTISGEELLQRVNNAFRSSTECIPSGGQHFSASAAALVGFC
jgi:hypothetical protein